MQKTRKFFSLVMSCLLCLSLIPTRGIAEISSQDSDATMLGADQNDAVGEATVLYRVHRVGEAAWNDDAQGWISQDADILKSHDDTSQRNEAAPLDSLAIMLSGLPGSVAYRLSAETQEGKWAKDGQEAQVQDATKLEVILEGDLSKSHALLYRWHTNAGWSQWEGLPSKAQDDDAVSDQGSSLEQTADSVDPQPKADAIDDVQIVLVPIQVATDYADSNNSPQNTSDSANSKETSATEDALVVSPRQNEKPLQEQDDPAIVEVQSSAETPAIQELASTNPSISYVAHVQSYGWLNWVSDGTTAGTTGEARRMEAIQLKLNGINGGIRYRTHVQTYGWQTWAEHGEVAGTTYESKRMEAIRIELTGNVQNTYDIYYRAHVQSYGWLAWVKNGEIAGTTGEARRLEALEIILVPKGMPEPDGTGTEYRDYLELVESSTSPSIHYSAHVQTYGWLSPVEDGATAGTVGENKRLEAIRIALASKDGGVEYRAHVQGYGWMEWERNGSAVGTTGEARYMDVVQIQLTGDAASNYDIYYRTSVQDHGWLGWAKNGAKAGVAHQSKRIEAIQILIVEKGTAGPTPQTGGYIEHHMDGVDISGWDKGIDIDNLDAEFTIIKSTEGVKGTVYNPDYIAMADKALENGMKIGFYHYANGGNATAEAETFYQSIKAYKGRAIACLDWEGQGNPSFNTGIDVIWCKTFLDRLKALFGGTPFIYTSKNYTNSFDWTNVSNSYPLWGAQYADMNPLFGYQSDPWQSKAPWGSWGTTPRIFQYTSTGVLVNNGGIAELDLDLFYGTPTDWDSYCK